MSSVDHSATPFICETCGVQHAASPLPPERCAICEDERQYVGWNGQRWTTLEQLRARHRADIREEEPGLLGIGMSPSFGIGQRALLINTAGGNVLWDCVALLDDAIVATVSELGGLAAIAISHPHYYATMVDWSRAFEAPVYIHAADREWVMRPDERVVFWDGNRHQLGPGVTLLRLGGHFEGGTVLHWADGQSASGALLSGDIIQVVQDRRWVSFMRSYPNLIPLSPDEIERIVSMLEPYDFERVYGAWYGRIVHDDAKRAIARSAERYVKAVTGS